ncbi:MAG: hypothetical protein ACR2RL_12530 [Gammaproteobacteria bacterium]
MGTARFQREMAGEHDSPNREPGEPPEPDAQHAQRGDGLAGFQAASEALWSVMQESLACASALGNAELQRELERRFSEIAAQCCLGFAGPTNRDGAGDNEANGPGTSEHWQDLSQLAAAAGVAWIMGSARYGQALAANYAKFMQCTGPHLGALYAGSEQEQDEARRRLVEDTRAHLRATADLVSREARQFEHELKTMSEQLRGLAERDHQPAEKPRRYARAKP